MVTVGQEAWYKKEKENFSSSWKWLCVQRGKCGREETSYSFSVAPLVSINPEKTWLIDFFLIWKNPKLWNAYSAFSYVQKFVSFCIFSLTQNPENIRRSVMSEWRVCRTRPLTATGHWILPTLPLLLGAFSRQTGRALTCGKSPITHFFF